MFDSFMGDPTTKSTLVIFFTAFAGAIAKVVKDRKKHWKDILLSIVASASMAFIAYLIADWQEVGESAMLVMVWAGSFLGREGFEVLEEVILTALASVKSFVGAYAKGKSKKFE